MVSLFNRLNTRKYRDHNEDSGLIRDRGQIKDKGQIKEKGQIEDRDQLEVFPIDGGPKLRYGVTIKQYWAGKRPEIIKEGDFINIIEKKYVRYVVEGRPYDRSFYSIDDTKFKTGTVKSIVEVGAPWPDEDGKGEHQKMKIILTNIDSAKEFFKGKVPRYVIPNIEGFSEEHIEIDDAGEPSHYYTRDILSSRAILSGRRKRKRRTRKVKRSNKPKKKPKKTPKKKPKKKHPKKTSQKKP